jgi:hypothetical protein
VRAAADVVASAVGAVVSGGDTPHGLVELRWDGPQDLAARRTQLLARPGVTAVHAVVVRTATA